MEIPTTEIIFLGALSYGEASGLCVVYNDDSHSHALLNKGDASQRDYGMQGTKLASLTQARFHLTDSRLTPTVVLIKHAVQLLLFGNLLDTGLYFYLRRETQAIWPSGRSASTDCREATLISANRPGD